MEMYQFMQKFKGKQSKENIFNFLYLMQLRHSALIWQKHCTWAMTESFCLEFSLLAVHVCIKTKYIIISEYLFFQIFHVMEGGKEVTLFLFVAIWSGRKNQNVKDTSEQNFHFPS